MLLASRREETESEDYANSHFSPKWSEKELKSWLDLISFVVIKSYFSALLETGKKTNKQLLQNIKDIVAKNRIKMVAFS